MPKSDVKTRNEHIITLANRVLEALPRVELAAQTELAQHSDIKDPNSVTAYSTNAMAHGYQGHESIKIGDARKDSKEALLWIVKRPFVVRVVAENDNGERRVIYVSRYGGLRLDSLQQLDGLHAAYHGPLGRLGEFPPGEEVSVNIPGRGEETFRILERVKLEPKREGRSWDALHDQIETENFVVTVESLREFRDNHGTKKPSEEDFIGIIEAEEFAAVAVFEGIRRKTVVRMSLRDLAVLDQFQGEVFRLPLNRRLMLSGPPGTGKTTTLIKRIAQKGRFENVSEEDRELVTEERIPELFHQGNWVMFAPTELLKLYLREAFNQEGIAAPDQRIRTWTDERRRLARDVVRILKSESAGRFTLADGLTMLNDQCAASLIELADAFNTAFQRQTITHYERHLRGLSGFADQTLAHLVARIRNAVGSEAPDFMRLFDVVALHEDITERAGQLESESSAELKSMLNALVARDYTLIPRIITLLRDLAAEDELVDDDDEPETDGPPAVSRDPKVAAARALREAVSAHAKESYDKRPRTKTGTRSRVLKLLDGNMPDEATLRSIGAKLVALEHLRFLGRTHRNLVDRVPVEYQRFRRAALAAEKWYRPEASKAITRGQVVGHEVDVMLLVMLRNANRFLTRDGGRALRTPLDTRYAVLNSIKGEYSTQVLVDEATDFSPVQLACMQELARPEFRSFFACGDVRQRVTPWGVSDLDTLRWVSRDFELREVTIGYRQSRPLALLAEELAKIGGVLDTRLAPPANTEDAGIPPLLGEQLKGEHLALWLCDRIREIERALGKLPSIAIFVDGEDVVDNLVGNLRPVLLEHNVDVLACKEGRVVGSEAQVRVFDIAHIKGLEFEAVFFVGIDRLAERSPELFDKFLFVGVTRAATYLGMTCENKLPDTLEPVRAHFRENGWSE